MKHIKKHPINDKSQQLSKDMKKQDLVKPKKDKKLDADDSLSDPKISKKYTKPSNKKLDGEKFLSGKKAKKVNENIDLEREEKARKYDEIDAKMAEFYSEGAEPADGLITIGEWIASYMGYL